MKQKFMIGTAAALMAMTSASALAEASANIAFATDYRFRGISQTDKDFAIQGGFDYAWDSGFYIGTWASNVDNFSPAPDGTGGAQERAEQLEDQEQPAGDRQQRQSLSLKRVVQGRAQVRPDARGRVRRRSLERHATTPAPTRDDACAAQVVNFYILDRGNPTSIASSIAGAGLRIGARLAS